MPKSARKEDRWSGARTFSTTLMLWPANTEPSLLLIYTIQCEASHAVVAL